MPTLIIRTGKHQGQKLVLPEAPVVIGRDEACQIRVASSDVSRRHCAIRPSPRGMLVRDLGSRNGTLVNDVAIEQETLLEPGDILRIGPMLFEAAGKKEAPQQPQAGEPQTGDADSVTDDNIANWLTGDEAPGEQIGPGDTTIIPNKPTGKPSTDAAAEADVKAKPAKIQRKKEFTSIAEEAADIIRRHWENADEEQKKKPQ